LFSTTETEVSSLVRLLKRFYGNQSADKVPLRHSYQWRNWFVEVSKLIYLPVMLNILSR